LWLSLFTTKNTENTKEHEEEYNGKRKRQIMRASTILTNDNLTKAGERAIQAAFEKIKRETLPLDLKRPAVQERLKRLAEEAEKTKEPVNVPK